MDKLDLMCAVRPISFTPSPLALYPGEPGEKPLGTLGVRE